MENKKIKWEEIGAVSPTEGKMFSFIAEGDEIVGEYVDCLPNQGQNHNSFIYSIKRDDGIIKFWGCKVLDDKMAAIEKGDMIKVIYGGTAKSEKGNIYKLFTVFRAE